MGLRGSLFLKLDCKLDRRTRGGPPILTGCWRSGVAEQTPVLMAREDNALVCVCVCFDADHQRHIYCRIVHTLRDARL